MKKKKFFLFFLKVGTMGTKARIVIYQHLFARFCIFDPYTIGIQKIQIFKKVAIPTT